ncbi:MAG: hypothetical protein AB7N61_05405 [Acidimicrobiia bacterium]
MSNRSIGRAAERWLISSGDERRLLLCHGGHAASNGAVNVAFAATFMLSTSDHDAGSLTGFLVFALLPFALLAPMVGSLSERFDLGSVRTLRNGYKARIAVLLALMVALASGPADVVVYPLTLALLSLQKLHTVTVYSSVPLLHRRRGSLLDANARVTRMATAGSLVGAVIGSMAAYTLAGPGAIAIAAAIAAVSMRLVPVQGFGHHRTDRIAVQTSTPGAVVASGAAFALVKMAIGALVIVLGSAAASGEHHGRIIAVAALVAYTIGGSVGTVVVPRLAQVVLLPTAMLAAAMLAASTAAVGALWLPEVLIPTMAAFVGLLGSVAHQHRDHVFQDTVPCHQLRPTFARWDGAGQVAWVLGAVTSTLGGLLLVDAVRLTGTVALASALVAVALPQRRHADDLTFGPVAPSGAIADGIRAHTALPGVPVAA